MTAVQLIRQFEFNQMVITRLLADVSREDALRPAGPDGKCVNWLLGHVIHARGKLLAILGSAPTWHESVMAIYGQAGTGTFRTESARPLAELSALLDETIQMLTAALVKAEAKFDEPCTELPHVREGGTVADRVGSYVCHEAYHAGQIGLLHRFLGKPGIF